MRALSRNDVCFCGSGKKRKKCHRDIEPGSAFAEMVDLHNRLDETIQEGIGNIRCRKGCHACCYQHFGITSVEFYYMLSHIIDQEGMSKAQSYIDKGYQDYLLYKEEFPEIIEFLQENHQTKTNEELNQYMSRYFEINKKAPLHNPNPCPFLDPETKGCSAYDYRPTVCRSYGVSYETRLDVPFMLCEHIPDGIEYQDEMADVSAYSTELAGLGAVPVDDVGVVIDKTYPIFYFCKIVKENPHSLTHKISEYKSYNLKEVMRRKVKRANLS